MSNLQNCKRTHFCCLELPSLWYFLWQGNLRKQIQLGRQRERGRTGQWKTGTVMQLPRWPQPLRSFGVGKTCGNISGGGRGPLCLQRPFAIGLTQEGVKPQIRQSPSTGGNILERNSAVSYQLLLPAAGAWGQWEPLCWTDSWAGDHSTPYLWLCCLSLGNLGAQR